ncbi:hypothetical protein D3C75_1308630 [compost metagenome]
MQKGEPRLTFLFAEGKRPSGSVHHGHVDAAVALGHADPGAGHEGGAGLLHHDD